VTSDSPETDSSVVHIAAPMIVLGAFSQQRCAWCGESLMREPAGFPEEARRAIHSARTKSGGPQPFALVRITTRPDGEGMSVIGRFVPDDELPADICVYRVPDGPPESAE
jgi:hypothetical protein